MQVSEEDRKRRQGRVILVVDDDPTVAGFMQLILQHAGFTVIITPSGEAAITTIARIKPVAILLDVNLDPAGQAMDGYQTCKRIRENYRDLDAPVIFVTVRKTREDVKRAVEVGGNSFVTKPIVAEALLERVVHALGRGKIDRRRLG
jgi:DNA-binding response OmpR family regulator